MSLQLTIVVIKAVYHSRIWPLEHFRPHRSTLPSLLPLMVHRLQQVYSVITSSLFFLSVGGHGMPRQTTQVFNSFVAQENVTLEHWWLSG